MFPHRNNEKTPPVTCKTSVWCLRRYDTPRVKPPDWVDPEPSRWPWTGERVAEAETDLMKVMTAGVAA